MTKRFENAVMKLYNAFHKGELNAFDCTHCAVGNICGNTDEWVRNWFTDTSNGRIRQVYKNMGEPIKQVKETGYSTKELSNVELIFLKSFYNPNQISGKNKERQFKGLCAVVEYLCELDNIPNVMDYKWLFESEENKPEKVFSYENSL